MATFGSTSTTDDVLDGVDLTGVNVVVTGTSAGLGVETARAVAARGATVVGIVRDVDKARRNLDEVGATGVDLYEADLASLASIRSFADAFYADGHDRIDVPDLAGIGGEVRPGIVHRLDKDTSGTIVIAKNESALRNLQAQFKSRKVEKRYIALVEGKLGEDQGRIVAPLGRDPRNRKRQAVILGDSDGSRTARAAATEYKVLARYTVPLHNDLGRGNFTLVQAQPITGRTHQIRIHFAWLGHPLVGDPIYGLRRQRLNSPRLFLHAASLAFTLPSTGQWVEFNAPLPSELQDVLQHLVQVSEG